MSCSSQPSARMNNFSNPILLNLIIKFAIEFIFAHSCTPGQLFVFLLELLFNWLITLVESHAFYSALKDNTCIKSLTGKQVRDTLHSPEAGGWQRTVEWELCEKTDWGESSPKKRKEMSESSPRKTKWGVSSPLPPPPPPLHLPFVVTGRGDESLKTGYRELKTPPGHTGWKLSPLCWLVRGSSHLYNDTRFYRFIFPFGRYTGHGRKITNMTIQSIAPAFVRIDVYYVWETPNLHNNRSWSIDSISYRIDWSFVIFDFRGCNRPTLWNFRAKTDSSQSECRILIS